MIKIFNSKKVKTNLINIKKEIKYKQLKEAMGIQISSKVICS